MHKLTTHAKSSTGVSAPCGTCSVVTHGLVEVGRADLPTYRRQVGPVGGSPLPAAFIRHMDDQTMTGLSAIYQALHAAGMKPEDCRDWGVIAAPRFLGRSVLAVALPKFMAEGAWGVSPHTIPYFSLHAMAGAISQALKVHGPNLGVGGGPDGEVEALLAAMAMLHGYCLPGVWVALTGWEPELIPDAPDAISPPVCHAIALALTPVAHDQGSMRLSVVPHAGAQSLARPAAPASASSRCKALMAFLNDKNYAAVHWPMAGGGVLAWRRGTDEKK